VSTSPCIAGVVVLFHPDADRLRAALPTYSGVAKLYVVANSPATDLALDHPNLELIHNPENLGIAAALNPAARRALG
jgi:GT2 family glycosyltransferase